MSTIAASNVVAFGEYASTQSSERVVVRHRLRLTRRGRAVFSALVALPFAALVFVAAINAGGATATSTDQSLPSVTVEHGQSLWELASIIAPSANTADVVSDLISFNELETGVVIPGQTLVIPARYAG